jgi:3-oxoacyl-[acyl-carrier-protein] synthase III
MEMTTPTVSLVDVSTYLPENRVSAEYYANFARTDELRENFAAAAAVRWGGRT